MFFKYKRELERVNAEKRTSGKEDVKASRTLPQLEISVEECSNKPKEAYVESYEPQANDGDSRLGE